MEYGQKEVVNLQSPTRLWVIVKMGVVGDDKKESSLF